MIAIAGILIVFAAVIGGFVMENGSLAGLAQPGELLIIVGSAFGAMMAANPMARLVRTARSARKVFLAPVYTQDRYLATLAMLYNVFRFARRHTPAALEDAVEDPDKSVLFIHQRKPGPEELEFICDTLRMSAFGSVSHWNMTDLIETDLESRRAAALGPVDSMEKLADSLPGFGIVAAVLGVIISMGAMRDTPLKIGMRIASALIGTFTGILLAYGFVSPMAARMEKIEEAESAYFDMLGAGLAAFARGLPAAVAVECARRAVPSDVRPDFEATERACHDADRERGSPPQLVS
jgi:chemotaxis protein MotA